MRRVTSMIALLLGLVACRHAPLDTAKLYSARGDDLLAVEYLVYAIDDEPENTSAYENRAECYQALGKYNEAITDCSSWVQLAPTNACAYMLRAQVGCCCAWAFIVYEPRTQSALCDGPFCS